MSLIAKIKRKVSRAITGAASGGAPGVSDAELAAAYRVLTGGRVNPERLAALRKLNALFGWDAQGILLNLLIEPEVTANLNLCEIARTMYEHRALSPLTTPFGSVIYGYPCDQFVYGTIKRTGQWEPHIEAFLRRWCEPGAVAVDVGANCGYFSALLSQLVGPTGSVHAFEPAGHLVAALEKTRDANGFPQLHIHQAAAGEVPAERVTLHVDLINAGGNQVLPDGFQVAAGGRFMTVECPVVTLDEELRTRAKPVRVMKVDVEGFELSVFRGASEIIQRDRPAVCFEFAPDNMTQKGSDPVELVQTFLDAGYEFAFHNRPAPPDLTAARFCELVSREYVWTEVFATPG
jgi:FkbM family methyltransferase